MMMTRFTLTLVLGVLLSLGTVVTGGFFGQAQAGNWNSKNGQEFGMPEVRSHFFYNVNQEYDHVTSDFDHFVKRLGHLSQWVSGCQFYMEQGRKKDLLFDKYASPKDKALYNKKATEEDVHSGISHVSNTACTQTRVSEVFNIIDKTISWLKENPGSNLPELSEWQSKILKKADVGVTQVASAGAASFQQALWWHG